MHFLISWEIELAINSATTSQSSDFVATAPLTVLQVSIVLPIYHMDKQIASIISLY